MLGPITEGWTHRQLLAGRALLLVDGVDELTDGERPKVRRWLGRLLRSYPRTRIVVTSRPAAAERSGCRARASPPSTSSRSTPGTCASSSTCGTPPCSPGRTRCPSAATRSRSTGADSCPSSTPGRT
ncbi:NACHT domain-containing protein [Saccharopolyspora spinosporotrichia]